MNYKDVSKLMNRSSERIPTFFIIILMIFFTASCVQDGGAKKKIKGNDNETQAGEAPNEPEFDTNNLNFIQDGQTQYRTNYSINADFTNSFLYRGFQIDRYIKDSRQGIKHCLIIPFSSLSIQKVLVIAATPEARDVFETSTREYYYSIRPSQKSDNQNFCQTPGNLTNLATNYIGLTPVFSLSEVCPNCVLSETLSDSLTINTTSGQVVTDILSPNLKIRLNMTSSSSSGNNDGQTCSTNDDCLIKNRGYDCCSFGQCIKDKEVKSTTNTSSIEYAQSISDIIANPNNIFNYPHLYHLCGTNPDGPLDPTTPTDPITEREEMIRKKKALYKCTTPIDGERSICQKEIKNVTDLIIAQGNSNFYTDEDDLSFTTFFSGYSGTVRTKLHSIEEVVYAGNVLYQNDNILTGMTIGAGGSGTGNDDVTTPSLITINYTPTNSAPNDTLYISYNVNGSCEKVNNQIAKCHKIYNQGQDSGLVTDHSPITNDFIIPYYANLNQIIQVFVDDTATFQGADWNLVLGAPSLIQFTGPGIKVTESQKVKIVYYVNLQTYPTLMVAKEAAQNEISTICNCGNNDCSLEEVIQDGEVIDYKCSLTGDTSDAPLKKEVTVTTKNIPMRFFGVDGSEKTNETLDSSSVQEGNLFGYTNNNLLKPNNVDQYIGINEIYGSQSIVFGAARPPIQVRVKNDKIYDIATVAGGIFGETCYNCSNDYYSNLVKMFPSSSTHFGGGYTPSPLSNPFTTRTNKRDDQLFGRACFVPVTMLPWSHRAVGDVATQRLNRLATQHFYFANGAGRDWYGFDYGSLIGSFDGIKWFSVGHQRRIKAESNTLYLAVNAIAVDQTTMNSYKVLVQDAILATDDYEIIDNDYDSKGAECQQYHSCKVDKDCISQLGYDYSCEFVGSITTSWPIFDINGNEIADKSTIVNLRNLLGTSLSPEKGGDKRCVYRARGSACMTDYTQINTANNYDGTANFGMHACSSNSYCQRLTDGALVEKFNDRITRYAKSVKFQNSSSDVPESDLDQIGLGSRVLGRPFSWQGENSAPANAMINLASNNVNALCIPGKSSQNNNLIGNSTATPSVFDQGDQIAGIGVTPNLIDGNSGVRDDYLSRCAITGTSGNYLYKEFLETTLLSSTQIRNLASSQALPSNSLAIFEAPQLTDETLVKNFESSFIEEFSYQQDRCLRAPGATCFSDLECAPNIKTASLISSVDPDDTNLETIINKYEIQFWKEALVCSQEFSVTDPEFDISKNRCCRETGKIITIGSGESGDNFTSYNNLNPKLIPGVNISLSDSTRYSRVSTAIDLMTGSSASDYPALEVVVEDQCTIGAGCGNISGLEKQYNTFAETAARTCCSQNWVREFHQDENGGGHEWSASKMQHIPKESLRCYNWEACAPGQCGDDAGDDFNGFTCSHVDDSSHPNCRARNVSETNASTIFSWLEKFELIGIPQIAIESGDHLEIACRVNPDDQSDSAIFVGGEYVLPPNIIKTLAAEDAEYQDVSLDQYFSASDLNNFNTDNIKKIFSADTVSCCLPAGTDMGPNGDADQCCTGFINGNTRRCALPDFTDVTLYLNRYVSSEASSLAKSAFDSKTGYLLNNNMAFQIACEKKLCASGLLAPGISYASLPVRGLENKPASSPRRRFVDGNDISNNQNKHAELYDKGLRWNNHYYCVPEPSDGQDPLPGTLDCDNF